MTRWPARSRRSLVEPSAIRSKQNHARHGDRGVGRGIWRYRHLAAVHHADVPQRAGRTCACRPRSRARRAFVGVLSITLITTVKYVLIAMRIDNKGEGGIFALYSLVRKYGAWLAIPAMLGGAAFLADSVLTPAVSISSAVEGLETLPAFEKLFTENKQLTLMITAASF